MNAISAALAGMHSALSRFDRASNAIARSTSGVGDDDLANAIVDQIQAKVEFRANAQTLRAADEMARTILDLKV
jgi:hypothetical protein